ncbi:transposase [Calothrix sp. NIES-4101]|nr:transposase [Calothrix sp. NIES-4101]BAZ37125.1 transposase [Calothrix sp. NIES-4101]BAZ37179.1 transposase [Calothrix sp. NIES-4101]BAZ37510.1 transposase [Calothrix sp. NIES-4101]BAZ37632.1 transposase [Calothrix sp. NIES-4101]
MPDILALLECLQRYTTRTTLRRWSRIISAMLAMSGRITMLGISRWCGKGGSYRTIQRFFAHSLPWAGLFWVFFREHIFCQKETYLLAGDEVVVSKAGKKSYGVDKFYSSLHDKPIQGLSFFALSLVSIEQRKAFPIRIEQVIKPKVEKQAKLTEETKKPKEKPNQEVPKKKGGRPKGSKNKDKTEVVFTSELLRIRILIQDLLKKLSKFLPLTYLVLDGHFGNNNAVVMTRQMGLQLISKMRYDSALYIPYENPDPSRKCRRKYGDRIDYSFIPDKFLKKTETVENIRTDFYQTQLLHKEFSQTLNVVIIVRTNIVTSHRTHAVLFSTELSLSYVHVIDYYSLRFQIEFNFRDAKQFFGLEDFMNVGKNAVTNAANLAFFMVNISQVLLSHFRKFNPDFSITDLKAIFRGYKYVEETIKLLPEKPDPVLLANIFHRVTNLGRIHPADPCSSSS